MTRSPLDRLRLGYTKRVITPSGQQIVVRARRTMDVAEPSSGSSWMLPLPMFLSWEVLREVRLSRKYQRLWLVETYPRYEASKATVLAELPRHQAFDMVDERAASLASTPDPGAV